MRFAEKFKRNRRGYFSFLIFLSLFFTTLFAELIANDKPLLVRFGDDFYFPILQKISEKKLGGVFETAADFRDPAVQELVKKNGWMLFPPIKFSYQTINYEISSPAPSRPTYENILGTDDQGRDVLARVIYGIRISLIFGLILSIFSNNWNFFRCDSGIFWWAYRLTPATLHGNMVKHASSVFADYFILNNRAEFFCATRLDAAL